MMGTRLSYIELSISLGVDSDLNYPSFYEELSLLAEPETGSGIPKVNLSDFPEKRSLDLSKINK
jgi:hypothetical protein